MSSTRSTEEVLGDLLTLQQRQAGEVASIERVIEAYRVVITYQGQEIERLRGALELFANPDNWDHGYEMAAWVPETNPKKIAKEALENP